MSETDLVAPVVPAERSTADAGTALHDLIVQGFRELKADLGLVASSVDVLKGRIDALDGRMIVVETWKTGNSERVRGMVSKGDMAVESRLAEEITARESLALKVDGLDAKQDEQLAILTRLDAVSRALMRSPLAKQAAAAIVSALLTWLTLKGLR